MTGDDDHQDITWNVYYWLPGRKAFLHLGSVEAAWSPYAVKAAWQKWPRFAGNIDKRTGLGRMVVRVAGALGDPPGPVITYEELGVPRPRET